MRCRHAAAAVGDLIFIYGGLRGGAAGKVYGTAPGTSVPYAAAELGIPSPTQFSSSFDNHGLGPKMNKDRSMEAFSSAPSVDLPFYKGTLRKALEHEGGILRTSANSNNTIQLVCFASIDSRNWTRHSKFRNLLGLGTSK